jgi:hypothetical protein
MFTLGYLTCCTKCGGCLKTKETRRCLRKSIQEHKLRTIRIKTPVTKCVMHEENNNYGEERAGRRKKHVWIFTLGELEAYTDDNS